MLLLIALLAGTAAGPDLPAFREETAVIYGDSREPKFRATRAYVLKLGANPKGKVFDLDIVKRRVKVSAAGEGLWVACDSLQPGPGACGSMPARVKRRSGNAGESGDQPLDRGLPSCPGDPRCPNGG